MMFLQNPNRKKKKKKERKVQNMLKPFEKYIKSTSKTMKDTIRKTKTGHKTIIK